MTIKAKIQASKPYRKLKAVLSQGTSKKEIILAAFVGSIIGVMPVFGLSTILGTFLAIRLKLNLGFTVLFTYLVSPLHTVLFLPFIHLGEKIYGVEHTLLTFQAIKDSFSVDYFITFKKLWFEVICGLSGWFTFSIPLIATITLVKYKSEEVNNQVNI
jgi:uncharacterized protein (DUF2062 family)